MIIKNMGSALRFCIPQSIGKKLGEFWELIKPLVDFKYEVVQYLTLYKITFTRCNLKPVNADVVLVSGHYQIIA